MNRLGSATSPYLRQHADNPVHWWEWEPAAFEEARTRDVPILLSVGYAACHWCHVMAHESFENAETAALMNDNFVNIKVDREERPDLDAVYMNATTAMTGQGGWPMTCFLTADGQPFYCGTYFPREPRYGMPSFTQLLTAITETWRTRRAEVDTAAARVTAELQSATTNLPTTTTPVTGELLDRAVQAVRQTEDQTNGGFGGAPKFPPSALLEGLLRNYERTQDATVLDTVMRTAEAMARGGIYDQLAGGFARYSVDAQWVVPHFEKMLYDNALLLRAYAHLARRTGSELAQRVTRETAEFLLNDLRTGEHGFASALDADTDGVEGATYAWTPTELIQALGPADGRRAAETYGVTTEGTFEHGTSVLQLPGTPDDELRTQLRAARNRRPQPARDDKVVTAWNGMAITALAEAGSAVGEHEWIAAAQRCARYLLDNHVVDGRVRRASLGGTTGTAAGVLEDHAWLATGLLALHQADGNSDWLQNAERILDVAQQHFAGDEPGTWFDTADDAEDLVLRPRDPLDGATPSGASSMAEALLTAAALTEPEHVGRYGDSAAATVQQAALILARAPRAAGHWLAVAEASVRGPIQIAVVGADAQLLSAARSAAPGGSVVVAGEPDSAPLLAGRPLVGGAAAAYVCRGFVCDRPVTDVPELLAALAR